MQTHKHTWQRSKIKRQVCKHKSMFGAQWEETRQQPAQPNFELLTDSRIHYISIARAYWLTITTVLMVYVQWLSLSCLCWSVWHTLLRSDQSMRSEPAWQRHQYPFIHKIPLQSCACVSLWYALSAYTRDKLIMEQLVAHIIVLMCYFFL